MFQHNNKNKNSVYDYMAYFISLYMADIKKYNRNNLSKYLSK